MERIVLLPTVVAPVAMAVAGPALAQYYDYCRAYDYWYYC